MGTLSKDWRDTSIFIPPSLFLSKTDSDHLITDERSQQRLKAMTHTPTQPSSRDQSVHVSWVRDWSLITGREGGYKTGAGGGGGGGGQVKFYPYEKRGGRKF